MITRLDVHSYNFCSCEVKTSKHVAFVTPCAFRQLHSTWQNKVGVARSHSSGALQAWYSELEC